MALERLTNNVALVRVSEGVLDDGATCVVYAGGCIHIARWDKTTQKFYITAGKRFATITGVSRIWLYKEGQ